MTVRAKFTVQSITRTQGSRWISKGRYEICEQQTVKLNPVYDPEPGSENHEFWEATPSGSIDLTTINAEAGNYFKLGGEYYIDFTQVGEAAPQG